MSKQSLEWDLCGLSLHVDHLCAWTVFVFIAFLVIQKVCKITQWHNQRYLNHRRCSSPISQVWSRNLNLAVMLTQRLICSLLQPLTFIFVYLLVSIEVFCCLVAKSSLTLWNTMDCSMPVFPVLHYLPEFAQTDVHWIDDTIQPSHPLSHPSPPALNLSPHQGLFQWVVHHIRWPKYWSFGISISPSNEYSGLISFRIDWFDLLAVQYHSLKALVLWF